MYSNYSDFQRPAPASPPQNSQERMGERSQERQLINAEEQIGYNTMGLPKSVLNLIADNDPDAIKACPYLDEQKTEAFSGVLAYIKSTEIKFGRYYGDEKERRKPLQDTLKILQEKLRDCKGEQLTTILEQINKIQKELDKKERPLPQFLMEAVLIAYKTWVRGTLINQPYLLERHVGRGGNNGHG